MAMYHCSNCGKFVDDDWHPMDDDEMCPDCHEIFFDEDDNPIEEEQ